MESFFGAVETMPSLSEQILQNIQSLSDKEQHLLLVFIEFLEYKRQQAATAKPEFAQTSQDIIQKRRDAYQDLA
ncbi:MAG: DUF2281 domain-containing protein [Cyanobacteria bacterium J06560_2]